MMVVLCERLKIFLSSKISLKFYKNLKIFPCHYSNVFIQFFQNFPRINSKLHKEQIQRGILEKIGPTILYDTHWKKF